jgi:hypothetical protein
MRHATRDMTPDDDEEMRALDPKKEDVVNAGLAGKNVFSPARSIVMPASGYAQRAPLSWANRDRRRQKKSKRLRSTARSGAAAAIVAQHCRVTCSHSDGFCVGTDRVPTLRGV